MNTNTSAVFYSFTVANSQYAGEDRVSPLKTVLLPTLGFPQIATVKSTSSKLKESPKSKVLPVEDFVSPMKLPPKK